MLLLKRHKNYYTCFKYKDKNESEIFVLGYYYKGKESKWNKLGNDEKDENGIKKLFGNLQFFLFYVLI